MYLARTVARTACALLSSFALLSCGNGGSSTSLPVGKVKHVFIITLENEGYDSTFGASSAAPYLATTLAGQGQLLRQYYGVAHVSLGNYIAMISGQAPTPDTQLDCTTYTDFTATGPIDADGQIPGSGCVYPTSILTIADQLESKGLTWRGYMEDMQNGAPAEPTTCRHPALGATDTTVYARLGDQYATRHDPFVYFHSIIDDTARCDANVVPFTELATDLASAETTPNYVFITPNLCNDGHDATCVDGSTGGLAAANTWLQKVVPMILASPAYQADGMLIITFDEAELDGSPDSTTSCCDEQSGPNVSQAGRLGPGGGRIGAVVLSSYVVPGSVNDTPYNHYSFLRTVEDLFEVPHLGYAGRSGLRAFGGDVFGRTP